MADPPAGFVEVRSVTTNTSGSADGLVHLADERAPLSPPPGRGVTVLSLCGVTLRDTSTEDGWDLGYDWRWPSNRDALTADCPTCLAELARLALEQAHG